MTQHCRDDQTGANYSDPLPWLLAALCSLTLAVLATGLAAAGSDLLLYQPFLDLAGSYR